MWLPCPCISRVSLQDNLGWQQGLFLLIGLGDCGQELRLGAWRWYQEQLSLRHCRLTQDGQEKVSEEEGDRRRVLCRQEQGVIESFRVVVLVDAWNPIFQDSFCG